MASFYSVVQYVPDPVSDERLNIGVVVFGDGLVRARFLHNLRRAQLFGGEDVTFIRELADRASQWTPAELQLPGLENGVIVSEEALQGLAQRWKNAVQFTDPRASTLAPDELLDVMVEKMLREPSRQRRSFRDRRAAAALARKTLRDALESTVGERWRTLYKPHLTVQGELDEHAFDVAISNGKPLLAAQGLSFEGHHTRVLEREVDATAWAVTDVRKRVHDLQLAIVALPPRTHSKTFDKARHIFDGLKTPVVTESEVEDWAGQAVAGLT